tara:strand:- start:2105 stop:3226 length:1122 start_codon:yes stop_codon:yes gene_type:complete
MATRKGVELRTDFTASDKNFQPVLKRTQRGVKKLGKDAKKAGEDGAKGLDKLKKKLTAIKTVAGKAAIAVAAVTGGAMLLRSKNEKASIIAQQASLADMEIERFQRLAHVLKGFRIEADETADIVEELRKVTGEAFREGDSTKANAFKMLHIDLEKFMKLNPIEQLQQLNESFNKIRKEDKGEFKAAFAMDELISDMGMKLKPLMKLPEAEFRRRLIEAESRIRPEEMIRKGAAAHERERGQVLGFGKEDADRVLSIFSGGFSALKETKFGKLGARSAFNPAITFDPEGAKAKDEADKKVAKEASTFEKTLKAINKGTNPYNMALMGMTVSGGGVRPSENKMLTVMEKLAALNAKGWEVQTKSLDLWESELKQ